MRIKKLDLTAFGPFTNQSLKFEGDGPGLHIIYGTNEAGKSSSLRGLKALLYGFPERTSDNFLHPSAKLLVGGCLQSPTAGEICFVRRKKRKGDLHDLDGKPLPASVLNPFLHSIELAVFESLYGLDHEDLVQGGREILAQKGEVGQALFSAGAGILSLRKVLASLDDEAESLFKARGSKQKINKAVAKYKELQKKIREATLSSSKWQELSQKLKKAEDDLVGLERERRAKDKELRRLERLRRTLPQLAQRRDLLAGIDELEKVAPVLPRDFADVRKKVEQHLYTAVWQHDRAVSRLEEVREKEGNISCDESILDQGALIEELYQRLGEYRKGLKDLPRLDGRRMSCRKDAAGLLKQIRPDLALDQVEILRPFLGKKKLIQVLAGKYEAFVQRSRQAQIQHRQNKQELEDVRGSLSQLADMINTTDMLQAVKLAERSGYDERIREKLRNASDLRKHCGQELKRLGLWQGELAGLALLPLPLPETVNRFERGFQDGASRHGEVSREIVKIKESLSHVSARINELRYGGEVVTEEELGQRRQIRDQGWGLLRRQWLAGEDVSVESRSYQQDLSLPDAFEENVKRADEISDRLRREADRVHQFATLQAKSKMERNSLEEQINQEKELQDSSVALAQEWDKIWQPCGIRPLPPKEMGAWLQGMEKVRFEAGSIGKIEEEIQTIQAERQVLRKSLIGRLKEVGESKEFPGDELEPVLTFADIVLDRLSSSKSEREQLVGKEREVGARIVNDRHDLQTAEEDLQNWRNQWREALSVLGVDREIALSEANEIVEDLQACFDKLREADDFRARIEGIQRDGEDFRREVGSVLKGSGQELSGRLAQQVAELHGLLGRAKKNQALLEKYSKEVHEAEEEVRQIEADQKSFAEQMTILRHQAHCEKNDELEEAEQASGNLQRFKASLSEIEEQLIRSADGLTLAELEGQAETVNPDELPGEIEILKRAVSREIDPGIKSLSQIIGEKKKELQLMDGSGVAADLAEAAEQLLARIRRLAGRYVQLKVSAGVLRQEIERYRLENQDPLLETASGYFKALTLGSFAGLRADEDSRGRPLLAGWRSDRSRVEVTRMSSGTRDQLYLALRLASLERRLEAGEPMPFIVDDILINFDDLRATATLEILASLGAKTQVILFTHHKQIVEAAGKIKTDSAIEIHRL
ncbi:MAG: AAA family ATPase [Thermodesulfobacteriota bacterium]|nr:AAA family ATPase [Thermodesulfobacteriota bacterium]